MAGEMAISSSPGSMFPCLHLTEERLSFPGLSLKNKEESFPKSSPHTSLAQTGFNLPTPQSSGGWDCTSESHRELPKKCWVPSDYPSPSKSETLWAGPGHQYFTKHPRYF